MQGSSWPDIRMKLVTGQTVELKPSLASRGTALTGKLVKAEEMPTYLGGKASRPLYPDDPKMPNPTNKVPLTEYHQCTQSYLRVVAHPSAPGGWYINSAWPE